MIFLIKGIPHKTAIILLRRLILTGVIPAPHQERDKLQRESRKHWMPDQSLPRTRSGVRHDGVGYLIAGLITEF
jgi:hypothetical protein